MMTFIVVPAARRGRMSSPATRSIGQRFSILTAIAGVAVLLTGAYLTSLQYTLTAIVTTWSGMLVIASFLSWILLVALLLVGIDRFARSLALGKPVQAANRSRRWFASAVVVSIVGVAIGTAF
ncbi:hypothetical protein AArcSl_3215 [Halalkaliarchaeum desulfuricum]|uniref:Uncharacterized protein n=2 Tax=Halalkaliarchaeum desulfuricum TaxID=2055893 RepID=A0A343TNZ9_9EURY|nr:hypothetical protein AArcSl_3215 [Halalkaliarchaeum desulfuricum]